MSCDKCKHYSWYYDKCRKFNCEVDFREVHNCYEPVVIAQPTPEPEPEEPSEGE